MLRYGKGPVRAIYMLRYMSSWKQCIGVINLYPYEGMDYRGDIELPIPLPTYPWGPMGMLCLLFHMFHLSYVLYMICKGF